MILKNFQEHPQGLMLTDSIGSTLQQLYPDGKYCIGQNSSIYWKDTEPRENGIITLDWVLIPYVTPTQDGKIRPYYPLWQEGCPPLVALAFVSDNGDSARDTTPMTGRFWICEMVLRVVYYGIYDMNNAQLEMYQRQETSLKKVEANDRDRYPVPALNLELGLWQGSYQNQELTWLRWWDEQGNMLLIGNERAEIAEQKAARLAERLRAMGVDIDAEDIDTSGSDSPKNPVS